MIDVILKYKERGTNMKGLGERLTEVLKGKGAALVGFADLEGICDMPRGVSVAVPLPKNVVEDLKTALTEEYYELYNSLNSKLNEIILAGEKFLKDEGFKAYARTTDRVELSDEWVSTLPHKTVATRAGLGWIGKNCLLITEQYGGAVRLSSIVTDAPLKCGEPTEESRCGQCDACVRLCPAGALSGKLWKAGMAREQLFQREICKKTQIERMKANTGIETDLCGLCFAVCPYTEKYLAEK